jgi:ribosomal protein L17
MLGLKGIQNPPQFAQAPGATYSSPIPMRMDGQTGNLASAMSRRSGALSDIRTGKPTARSAKFTLPGVNAATVEKLAKKAVGQGWDNSFVAWVKGANKPTRQNLKEMVNITKRRVGEMKDFSYNGRPSDVLGKSLKLRLDRVKQVQRQSGKMITKVAKKQLQGKTVDMTAPMESFRGKIMELGGRMNDKGELVFGVDSRLFGQASKAGALKKVYQKIESLGDVTDAYKAHELKLFIDELVDYGKSSKTGLSANVERLLKGFRAEINTTLQGISPAYDKVNTSYSMTTQALGDFQKAAGSSIDLFGPQADAATGRVLRKLLSNMQNRENLSAAMKQVEDVATQFGGKYADDLTAQAKAVNEIERLFGSFAETSFKGEITASGQRIAESPSFRQAGTEAVRLSAKQLRKMRQNETTQIRALEELIYQGGN